MDDRVQGLIQLTVNVGTSTVRLGLFRSRGGELERVAALTLDTSADTAQAVGFVRDHGEARIDAVVHRIVHGGPRLPAFTRVDADIEREIERLGPFAPLHNPPALAWLRALRATWPEAAIFAAFDTGFYQRLPAVATTYAIPRDLSRKHDIRRYGFHGLAHAWMAHRWRALRPDLDSGGRLISLQLGSGCSITATERGEPRDTSMGFTPLEGLVMATRSGDIDAGLVRYLEEVEALTPAALKHLLNQESGLAGLSGVSGDMRELLASNVPAARLAIDVYCYRARKYIGAYLAALRGADGIVFGGGVGEHADSIRAQILTGLDWAGVAWDPQRNADANGREARISTDGSAIDVYVIPVDEAMMMANYVVQAKTPELIP